MPGILVSMTATRNGAFRSRDSRRTRRASGPSLRLGGAHVPPFEPQAEDFTLSGVVVDNQDRYALQFGRNPGQGLCIPGLLLKAQSEPEGGPPALHAG